MSSVALAFHLALIIAISGILGAQHADRFEPVQANGAAFGYIIGRQGDVNCGEELQLERDMIDRLASRAHADEHDVWAEDDSSLLVVAPNAARIVILLAPIQFICVSDCTSRASAKPYPACWYSQL